MEKNRAQQQGTECSQKEMSKPFNSEQRTATHENSSSILAKANSYKHEKIYLPKHFQTSTSVLYTYDSLSTSQRQTDQQSSSSMISDYSSKSLSSTRQNQESSHLKPKTDISIPFTGTQNQVTHQTYQPKNEKVLYTNQSQGRQSNYLSVDNDVNQTLFHDRKKRSDHQNADTSHQKRQNKKHHEKSQKQPHHQDTKIKFQETNSTHFEEKKKRTNHQNPHPNEEKQGEKVDSHKIRRTLKSSKQQKQGCSIYQPNSKEAANNPGQKEKKKDNEKDKIAQKEPKNRATYIEYTIKNADSEETINQASLTQSKDQHSPVKTWSTKKQFHATNLNDSKTDKLFPQENASHLLRDSKSDSHLPFSHHEKFSKNQKRAKFLPRDGAKPENDLKGKEDDLHQKQEIKFRRNKNAKQQQQPQQNEKPQDTNTQEQPAPKNSKEPKKEVKVYIVKTDNVPEESLPTSSKQTEKKTLAQIEQEELANLEKGLYFFEDSAEALSINEIFSKLNPTNQQYEDDKKQKNNGRNVKAMEGNAKATDISRTGESKEKETKTEPNDGKNIHSNSNPRYKNQKREYVRKNEKNQKAFESEHQTADKETSPHKEEAKEPSKMHSSHKNQSTEPKANINNIPLGKRAREFLEKTQAEKITGSDLFAQLMENFERSEMKELLSFVKHARIQDKNEIIWCIEQIISGKCSDLQENPNSSQIPDYKSLGIDELLDKIADYDSHEVYTEHEKKFDVHEKVIENLMNKFFKSEYDKSQLAGAKQKIQEIEEQRTQYIKWTEEFVEKHRNQARAGTDKSNIRQQIETSWLIEQQRLRSGFPIYAKKSEIINLVEKNQFVILIGETGSGKSTQLVQYILESSLFENSNKYIACVQPRKLAVQSVSKRVAEELHTKIGGLVGYQTGGFSNPMSSSTRIKFVIDWLFLNELLEDRKLSKYSFVVIDEAHERNMNTDILLSLIKDAARLNPELRFVITSATLNEDLFVKYFDCPSIRVPGRTYPVEILYRPPKGNMTRLDAVEQLVREIIEERETVKEKNYFDSYFAAAEELPQTDGHILAFLSGVDEIEYLVKKLEYSEARSKYLFLPLHGRITPAQQQQIFAATKEHSHGKTKVIFATRIAETAVTINDISVVIDIGFDRDYNYDPKKRITIMSQHVITQAQANQRTGRAGRTRPGKCYRIYSEEDFNNLEQFKIPELKRMNLDKAVLRLKQFDIGDVINFDFIEKPDELRLKQGLENLKLLGALDEKEKLTKLGAQMGKLPTDPDISRVIIEAIKAKCEKEACKIISLMAYSGNLFQRGNNYDRYEMSDRQKFDFCHPTGDLLTFLNIFQAYESLKKNKLELRKWCSKNTLSSKCLFQAESKIFLFIVSRI